MADDQARNNVDLGDLTGPPLYDPELPGFSAEEFRESFGEDVSQTLDFATWRTDVDLTESSMEKDSLCC